MENAPGDALTLQPARHEGQVGLPVLHQPLVAGERPGHVHVDAPDVELGAAQHLGDDLHGGAIDEDPAVDAVAEEHEFGLEHDARAAVPMCDAEVRHRGDDAGERSRMSAAGDGQLGGGVEEGIRIARRVVAGDLEREREPLADGLAPVEAHDLPVGVGADGEGERHLGKRRRERVRVGERGGATAHGTSDALIATSARKVASGV